ncbi:hypothetical protein [Actinotalea solisilvae]|uniref:hypothetical protein n=1 Tax=Actinotalea solisilvae TaxID=2072922 RepID=UPI0018F1917A|nr:hypothetical protein [Actinotalea solisilvae]
MGHRTRTERPDDADAVRATTTAAFGPDGAHVARVRTADARGVPLVVLEGDPGYYGPRGFVAGASLGLRRPSLRIPPAAFQAVALAAHEPWMTGTVVVPDVFWGLDCVGLRAPSSPDGGTAP